MLGVKQNKHWETGQTHTKCRKTRRLIRVNTVQINTFENKKYHGLAFYVI